VKQEMDKYRSFYELAAHEVRGKDYDLRFFHRNASQVIVLAPHGGGIEPESDEIATAIAGAELSLYCFMGLKRNGNKQLHITSHNFDEPECLALLSKHQYVLAIHGCGEPGEKVLLGGLDRTLIAELSTALEATGIHVETSGHKYPGRDPDNICNRGTQAAGVQFELSLQFRRSNRIPVFVDAVRGVLLVKNRRVHI
jgi:phage replication-related protein YjqB (UPF0714/DUF867 family)